MQTHSFGKHFSSVSVVNDLDSSTPEANQQGRDSTIFTVENSTSESLMKMTQVRGESTIEYLKELNIDDVMNSSEFNWNTHKEPLSRSFQGSPKKVYSHMSLVRSDNNKELKMVQSDAPVIQNHQFFNYIRPMIDSGNYKLDSVASIDGGRSITAILKDVNLGQMEFLKNDPMEAFVLARMTRSSRPAIHIGSMLYRLICTNGMMSLVHDKVKVDLSKRTGLSMNHIIKMMNKSSELTAKVAGSMERMSKVSVSPEEADELFRRAMNLPWNDPTLEFDSEEELAEHVREMEKNDRVISKVFAAMEEEIYTLPNDVRGSLYHWYQALTRYVTHYRSKNANTRFREIHWGSGRKIIDEGFRVAVEVLHKHSAKASVAIN